MILSRGQKVPITKGRSVSELVVTLEWQNDDQTIEVDAAAFLLNEENKCSGDESFLFYGQPISADQSVKQIKQGDNRNETYLSLKKISPAIQKVAFTLTIHEGEERGQNFGQVSSLSLRIADKVTGENLVTFTFGEELTKETAIVVGELYLHKGDWKFSAVGSGFFGGLAALCENFGIEVESNEDKKEHLEFIHSPPVAATQEAVVPLTVTLKKKEAISIRKSEKVVATLEWKSKKDLDLYCFYVLKDGTEGKVYYRTPGHAHKEPYITLDGDAKGAGKETIIVHKPSELTYVLFSAYSAVSNGIGSFKSMKAKAVVDNQMGQRVTSPLFENNKFAYWVAIAKIDFTDLHDMSVSHVEKYSKSGTERSPLLYNDGSFEMNVGPIEFK
ncbi:TerD domain-containing protein [Pseudalkalibacillus hwajinpoensis]|uniref:Tellurium resistance protein n=1 Tax=Guptibacillus hwajinpoensis TaxID=208199 RepID=A0A4U1MDE2_9BACL|nr:TerD domain-containing protein [Pseudalkalibacillus hwajinpoensis]TKD69199.1 tellurium resistance protein [Pseudalkalibacillus hwajinpoensis]